MTQTIIEVGEVAVGLVARALLRFMDGDFVLRQFAAETEHFIVGRRADDSGFLEEGLGDGNGGSQVIDGVGVALHNGSSFCADALFVISVEVASLNLVTVLY